MKTYVRLFPLVVSDILWTCLTIAIQMIESTKRMDLWEETQWEPNYLWMSSLTSLEPKVSTFGTFSDFPQLLAMES
jgi:hypothetical protein